MKRKLWRAWQLLLVMSIPASIISLIICACMFDSESKLPLIIGAINLIWISIIVIANSDNADKRSKERKHEINDTEHVA